MANAKIISAPGTWHWDIKNGHVVGGHCSQSTTTCWEYDTVTKVWTVCDGVTITQEEPVTEPVLVDGIWYAYYIE